MRTLPNTTPVETIVYQWTLTTVNAVVIIINLVAIAMFTRFRHRLLTNNHNLLLFSLAIADFLVGAGGIVAGQLHYFHAHNQVDLAVFKVGAIVPYFGSFFISVSSLIIMTVDRLISVKFAYSYYSVMTRRRIIGLIVGVWTLVTILLVNQGVLFFVINDKGWTELRVRSTLLSIIFVIALVILSVTNTYLFIKVRRITNSSTYQMSRSFSYVSNRVGTIQTPRPKTVKKNTTSTKTCIWLTLLFIICWFPNAVYYLVWSSTQKAPGGRKLITVCLSLASVNSLMNPVVYLIQRKCFRHYLRNIFKRNSRAVGRPPTLET